VLPQCELSALCRNHKTVSAKTESSANVIFEYLVETKLAETVQIVVFDAKTETKFLSVSSFDKLNVLLSLVLFWQVICWFCIIYLCVFMDKTIAYCSSYTAVL